MMLRSGTRVLSPHLSYELHVPGREADQSTGQFWVWDDSDDCVADNITVTPTDVPEADATYAGEDAGRSLYTVTLPDALAEDDSWSLRVYDGRHDEERAVSLPDRESATLCENVLAGDATIGAVDSRFSHPISLVGACEHTVTPEEAIAIMNWLASQRNYLENQFYSGRYGYFVNRLDKQRPDGIQSYTQLTNLVAYYNDQPNLADVSVPDILGEYLAEYADVPATRQRLCDFGVDQETHVTPDADSALFAYWCAHLVVSDGVRAAEGFILNQSRPNVNYERMKTEAKQATYGERGEAWQQLVTVAVTKPLDEFKYVLGNFLYWTSAELRTYANVQPLVFQAAAELGRDLRLDSLWHRAEYQRLLSQAHKYRRDSCYEKAETFFVEAKDFAADSEHITPFDAQAAETHIRVAQYLQVNDYEAAVAEIEDGVDDLHDLEGVNAGRQQAEIVFLLGRKNEILGEHARENENDAQMARNRFQKAHDCYGQAGKEEAQRRVEQKLDWLED